MQMDTNWISSTLSESIFSQTLTSEYNYHKFIVFWIQIKSTYTKYNHSNCSFRYMTISDEWEIPEKQPFKDLVRVF